MAMELSPAESTTVIGTLWTLLLLAGKWAWNVTHKKIDANAADVVKLREDKADADEVNRQRGHVVKIFDKLAELERYVTDSHSSMERANHDRHVALLGEIHKSRAR